MGIDSEDMVCCTFAWAMMLIIGEGESELAGDKDVRVEL